MSANRVIPRRMVFGSVSLVLVLAACSGGGSEDSSATVAPSEPMADERSLDVGPDDPSAALAVEDAALPAAEPASARPPELVEAPGSQPLTAAQLGRSLAISASVDLQADDVGEAVSNVTALVTSVGGAVFQSEVDLTDTDEARARLVTKVPPAELNNTISALGGFGTVVARTQQTEDVTDQIIDVDARILTQRASVERIRALLDQAQNLTEVAQIEAELSRREAELEYLLAQQRNLGERVALATLTIGIIQAPPVVDEPVFRPVAALVGRDGPPSVGDAARAGWQAFTQGVLMVTLLVVLVAPFAITVGVVVLAVWMTTHRIRRRSSEPTDATTDAHRANAPAEHRPGQPVS